MRWTSLAHGRCSAGSRTARCSAQCPRWSERFERIRLGGTASTISRRRRKSPSWTVQPTCPAPPNEPSGSVQGFSLRVSGLPRTLFGGGDQVEVPRSHIDRVSEGIVHLRLSKEE